MKLCNPSVPTEATPNSAVLREKLGDHLKELESLAVEFRQQRTPESTYDAEKK